MLGEPPRHPERSEGSLADLDHLIDKCEQGRCRPGRDPSPVARDDNEFWACGGDPSPVAQDDKVGGTRSLQ